MRNLTIAALALVLMAGFAALMVEETQGATEHKFMNVPGRSDNNPYSNAVLVGDTLYLAGAIGIDPATGAPPPKLEDEVKIVMEFRDANELIVGLDSLFDRDFDSCVTSIQDGGLSLQSKVNPAL